MADESKTVIIDVQVESTKLEKTEKLLESNKRARQDLNKEIKNSNVVTEEQIKKRVQLQAEQKKLTAIRNDSIKKIKTETGSLNALRLQLANQTKERNNLNKSTVEGAKRFEELQTSIAGLNKEISGFEEAGGDFRRNVGNYPKVLGRAKKALITFGTALKALGIGLILSALAKLGTAFSQNREVATFFKVALEGLNIVISDFVNFIIGNSGKVVDFFDDIFKDPLGSIKLLGTAIKDNIIERFNSAIEVFGLAGKAIKQFFEGDFSGAIETAQEAGKEFVDVLTGVDNTFDRTIDVITETSDAIVNYTSSVVDAAKANVALAESAELVDAKNKILFESFDQRAEQLRQIRDEERNSINERIEANNQLSSVLEQQQQLQLDQQEIAIRAAEVQLRRNSGIENQRILLEAVAEKQAILADIEGRRSEQLANDLALNREKLELEQSLLDSENQRALSAQEFEAQQIENDTRRNEKLLENLDFELEIEQTRINAIIDANKEGTQARQDAEQELLKVEQKIGQKRVQVEKEISKSKKQFQNELLENTLAVFGETSTIGKAAASIQAGINVSEAITKALTAPWPLNFALAGLTAAAGAVQIAKINSTQTGTSAITSNSGGSSPSAPSVPSGGSVSSVSGGGGLAGVNASLLSQFSTAPTAASENASATGEAISNLPPIQVSVSEINEVNNSLDVKVTEATLG